MLNLFSYYNELIDYLYKTKNICFKVPQIEFFLYKLFIQIENAIQCN